MKLAAEVTRHSSHGYIKMIFSQANFDLKTEYKI